MKFKKAKTSSELQASHGNANYMDSGQLVEEEKRLREKNLWIHEWNAAKINADIERIGLKGSPTKVKKIQSVVLKASNVVSIEPTEQGVRKLIHELIEDHTLG